MRYGWILVILFGQLGSAQQRAAEVGMITDNDLYTSIKYDRYYTSGLEFYYRYLNKPGRASVKKKITEFRVGQYIYNPSTRNADNPVDNDRPFAGYLFGEAGINRFFENESVLKTALQVGYIGPNSFAEETQRLIHKVFGYKTVFGWQHQIRNTVALQAGFLYSLKLAPKQQLSKTDFHLQADVNVGTVSTGATVGLMGRIAIKPLLPVYESNLHGASLDTDKSSYNDKSELFVYILPALNYQAYDATIQGSMFDDRSPVTYDLIPFRFHGETGVKYRHGSWNLSYAVIYRGKEARNNSISGYYYGSINIGYLLK